MVVWLHYLDTDLIFSKARLDCFLCNIVNDVENGLEASFVEVFDIILKSSNRHLFPKIFHMCGQDLIHGTVIKYEYGRHSIRWSDGKLASEVNRDSSILIIDYISIAE